MPVSEAGEQGDEFVAGKSDGAGRGVDLDTQERDGADRPFHLVLSQRDTEEGEQGDDVGQCLLAGSEGG